MNCARRLLLVLWITTSGLAFAQNCGPFTDVPAGASYCADVTWMRSHGITLGCTGTTYCPADSVTRASMAVFMHRLARSINSENVITVAKAYGDFTSIQAAIDAAALVASDSNPMLVKVAPGIYEEQVTLKDFVDVQGSGISQTLVTFDGPGGTIVAGASCELREIQIQNSFSGTVPGAVGVYQTANTGSGFTLLSRVNINTIGPLDNTGIYVSGGSLTVEGRSVTPSPIIGSGEATGIYVTGASTLVAVRNTSIGAGTGSLQRSVVVANGATARIANSQLSRVTAGTPTCINTYTGQFLPRTCD